MLFRSDAIDLGEGVPGRVGAAGSERRAGGKVAGAHPGQEREDHRQGRQGNRFGLRAAWASAEVTLRGIPPSERRLSGTEGSLSDIPADVRVNLPWIEQSMGLWLASRIDKLHSCRQEEVHDAHIRKCNTISRG